MVRKLKLRELTSVPLILLTPCAVLAADTDTAVLYGTGSVYLNGSQLANSSPVTSGDVIQTKETGAANLNAAGSSIVIQSNTIVRMQSNVSALDRGSVSMATGKGMAVLARDFKIAPVSGDWTEFYVSRASGVIQIMARKNAITIGCGPNTTTIREGQQLSRDDAANCGLAERAGAGAAAAAKAPILNSTWAEIAGLGTGGVIVGLYLSKGDDPLSRRVLKINDRRCKISDRCCRSDSPMLAAAARIWKRTWLEFASRRTSHPVPSCLQPEPAHCL